MSRAGFNYRDVRDVCRYEEVIEYGRFQNNRNYQSFVTRENRSRCFCIHLGCVPLGWSGSESVIQDQPGSWCINESNESPLGMDSLVPLTHHDPAQTDLGLLILIQITPREHTLTYVCVPISTLIHSGIGHFWGAKRYQASHVQRYSHAYDILDTLLFCYSLTGARLSISSKSSFTGTSIRATSIVTIRIDVTHGDWSAAFVHVWKRNANRS